MATKGTRYYTMRDLLSGRTPNGFVDKEIVEMMAQENPVLQDVLWKECNKGREDFVTIRTGMPEAVTRVFYEGFKGSKTSKKQVTNSCCTCTTGLEFDWRMYEQDKDKVAFFEIQKAVLDEILARAFDEKINLVRIMEVHLRHRFDERVFFYIELFCFYKRRKHVLLPSFRFFSLII